MAATIHKAVVHRLVKEQHKGIENSHMRDSVLDPGNEHVQKLIYSLISVYGTRHSTAQYGIFSEGEGRGAFPDAFESYAEEEQPSDEQFMALSQTAMERLYQQASSLSAASGGYIVFADLESQVVRQYLVVMVKEKPGLTLTESLHPEELMELDLSRVYQGARISFGKLADYQIADDVDKQEIRYLSFVSPSSVKATAGYFVTALGCEAGTQASRATDAVLREGKRLFRETEGLCVNREAFESELFGHLDWKREEQEPVTVSEIAHLVQQHIPTTMADSADDIVDQFVVRLNSDECQVPPEFPVHSATLNRHTHISGQSTSWQLTLERGALGTDPAAQVCYDREQGALILHNVPDTMKEQIEEEIAARPE